ncbi:MAG: MATE family efflux transporter, partial [Oscillospiraceae bacterium]|nr:MATE family efflux transporter [Oscillospiraceae bacterium]
IAGFANLCGMGGAPLCSIARGADDKNRAEHIMGNSFSLLLIFSVLLTAVGLIFLKPLLYFFGSSDNIYPYARAYASIYLVGTVASMVGVRMNPFINLQGFTKTGMITTVLGAVINIILDPVFIFVFNLGIRGAAIATVIAQTCSAVWVMCFLTGKRAILKLRLKCLRVKLRTAGMILSLGLAGMVMSLTNSLVQIVSNKTLLAYGGDMYVSCMTVITSVHELSFACLNGFTGGASPFFSYNYGAKTYQRVRKGIMFMTVLGAVISAVTSAIILIFTAPLIRIFNSDAELVRICTPAMRIYFCMFVFMSLQMAGQTVSQSLGRAKTAVFFSLLRKAFIVAPLTILLPGVFGMGVTGVFVAEPISCVVGGLACFITMLVTVYIPLGKKAKGSEA